MRSIRRKPPTLRDIAESAGVSPFTVSVVLNGSRSNTRVSEDTRRRIQDVAQGMGYYPNAMAQGLMRRRVNAIGVLFGPVAPSAVLMNPYSFGVLQGILSAACDLRHNVTLFSEPWVDAATSARSFRDGRTDGVIVIAPVEESDMVAGLTALGVPLVAVAYPGPKFGVPSVDVDNEAGIAAAVAHLVTLGHRRIAHIGGNENMASVPVRRTAFAAALQGAGLSLPSEYLRSAEYDGTGAGEATCALLRLPEPPTALVAGNDSIALGALSAAREAGVSVPGALSLVGFDDAPTAALVTPPLTTIRQPLADIGAMAIRLLHALVDGETVEAKTHLLSPELVVRGSTAAPCLSVSLKPGGGDDRSQITPNERFLS